MNRLLTLLWGLLVWIMPTVAWAEESHGYSRGNAFIYYAAIAAILIYGINDTFHIKTVTWPLPSSFLSRFTLCCPSSRAGCWLAFSESKQPFMAEVRECR